MKLYDVPRNTRIRVPAMNNEELLFERIDGMYSICVDDAGDVVHLSVFAEVEIVRKETHQ